MGGPKCLTAMVDENGESREELQRYKRIIEHVGDAIWVHNPDGTLRFVNEPPADALGLTSDEVAGADPVDILATVADSEQLSLFRREVQQILSGARDSARVELPLHLEERTRYLDIRLTYAPVGGERGVIGLARNIDAQKQREQELERQNRRLDEFASVVSHDLRNPLNIADGWLDVAREEYDSDALEKVAHAHNRMTAIVDDVLALAQGEEIVERQPVTLAEIATDSWDYIDTNGATLQIDSNCRIRADRSRLRQLLENLLQNAVDHAGDNVSISVGELDSGTGFYIADDGPGVPADEREQIFERGHSQNAEGTGFGLAIVKEIANAHGWSVNVADSSTGGTRFEITNVERL